MINDSIIALEDEIATMQSRLYWIATMAKGYEQEAHKCIEVIRVAHIKIEGIKRHDSN